jgi:hypothetical protein
MARAPQYNEYIEGNILTFKFVCMHVKLFHISQPQQ